MGHPAILASEEIEVRWALGGHEVQLEGQLSLQERNGGGEVEIWRELGQQESISDIAQEDILAEKTIQFYGPSFLSLGVWENTSRKFEYT